VRFVLRWIALPVVAVALAGCGGGSKASSGSSSLPQGTTPSKLDPSKFTIQIDNPYWPIKPGSHWVYREVEGGETQRVDVKVTDKTKVLNGVTTRIVHDQVTRKGQVVEDTYDLYAQDSDGNIWYLGEDTKEYEDGKVSSTKGSWEAGVDGALAGVLLPADPKVGMTYRQEYYEGEAEDRAKVESVDESADLAYGSYDGVLKTRETTALEPDLVEHKYYAKGVGVVLVLANSKDGPGREELISFKKG
jgi:hypothetical protein